MFNIWRNSPGHNANMIATNVNKGAVCASYYNNGGTYYYYGAAINVQE